MYLAALGDFEVLRDLFGKIVIPRAVFREIAVGGAGLPVAHSVQGAMASWLSVKDKLGLRYSPAFSRIMR
jgi:predicted nucleic acid-binding protein